MIQEAWASEKVSVVQQLRRQSIVLGGDARCESPGHMELTRSCMLLETNRRPQTKLLISNLSNAHNHMEPEGMKYGLKQLLETGKLDMLTTDRYIMVSSIMKKQFPFINHQYDVWHISK